MSTGIMNWLISMGGPVTLAYIVKIAMIGYKHKAARADAQAHVLKYLKKTIYSFVFFMLVPVILTYYDGVKPEVFQTFLNGSRSISRTDFYVDILAFSAFEAIFSKWEWHHLLWYTLCFLLDDFLPIFYRLIAQSVFALVYILFNVCKQFKYDDTIEKAFDKFNGQPGEWGTMIAEYYFAEKDSRAGNLLRGFYHLVFPIYLYLRYVAVDGVGLRSLTADDYLGNAAAPAVAALESAAEKVAEKAQEVVDDATPENSGETGEDGDNAGEEGEKAGEKADSTDVSPPPKESDAPAGTTPAEGEQGAAGAKSSAPTTDKSTESDTKASTIDAMHTFSYVTLAVALVGALFI
jgi:hypothetical protein